MNKKLLTLLTLTFLVSVSSHVFAFSDIEGHWAEKAITSAEKLKIINGYSDNSFKPDEPMTRAELVAVINRLLNIESQTDKYVPDVTSQDWFHSDIRKAINMGIIQGDDNGFVKPNDLVTREQAALIMARAFCVNPNNEVVSNSFVDEDEISNWAKDEILTFIKKQYFTGYPDNTLRPKVNITRAEILTVINRIINFDVNTTDSKLNGNILIREKNISLKNKEIYGDLFVGEAVAKSLNIDNSIIKGNLVLYAPIKLEENKVRVNGSIIKIYEQRVTSNSRYTDNVYGITFSLPDGATVIKSDEVNDFTYDFNDLIIVDTKQEDTYYFQTIEEISKVEIKSLEYDSIFRKIEEGILKEFSYELYKDNSKSSLLIIKRDNIVYRFLFTNIVSENILDNVMSNIEFISGDKVVNHKNTIYKNSKLCLKFNYRDGYVGVDDSYNTGVVYSGNAFFKLFIQVNTITDIDEYSISEVTALLKTLTKSDGQIVDQKVSKIYNHDTIQFEIISEDDKIISLYVIVGNNLYNFIFKGDKDKIDSVGKDIFYEIVNSMEF